MLCKWEKRHSASLHPSVPWHMLYKRCQQCREAFPHSKIKEGVRRARTDSVSAMFCSRRRQQAQSVSEAPATPVSPATKPSSSQNRLLMSVTCGARRVCWPPTLLWRAHNNQLTGKVPGGSLWPSEHTLLPVKTFLRRNKEAEPRACAPH